MKINASKFVISCGALLPLYLGLPFDPDIALLLMVLNHAWLKEAQHEQVLEMETGMFARGVLGALRDIRDGR